MHVLDVIKRVCDMPLYTKRRVSDNEKRQPSRHNPQVRAYGEMAASGMLFTTQQRWVWPCLSTNGVHTDSHSGRKGR